MLKTQINGATEECNYFILIIYKNDIQSLGKDIESLERASQWPGG